MRYQRRGRNAVAVVATTLVTFALGVTLAVLVAGSASALGPLTTTATSSPTPPTTTSLTTTTKSPADQFIVLNGTVNAASDHEIVASSAFPNFTTGAVDNYYSMARSHVDNSPFAEGLASPADTGPVGQTAAAGNFQQPQYADARWPGGPDNATYGSQGGPFAEATADVYRAKADASEPSRGMSGPGLSLPKGFDIRLQQALNAWKATWLGRLAPKTPAKAPTVTPTVPQAGVTVPKPAVTTPIATVTAPRVTSGTPTPPPVLSPTSPTSVTTAAPRSMASVPTPHVPVGGGNPKPASMSGEESSLTSTTKAALVPASDVPETDTIKADTTQTDTTQTTTTKSEAAPTPTYALVTSGESSLGRVSLGGGQIVIEGIHVTASIANNGTPAYSATVTIAHASIGGIPVTIDQDGVHIAGHGQGLPYQQASDALNSALNHAGIQLFLVAPQVTNCGASGSGTGTGGGAGTTTTTSSRPTSGDQSGSTSPCGQPGMGTACDQPGTGSSSGTTTTTTTSSDQSGTNSTTSPCGPSGGTTSCDQSGTETGTTTTTAGGVPGIGATTPTTTTSSTQSSTTATPSSCGTGTTSAGSSCSRTGTSGGTTTTTSNGQSYPTGSTGSSDQFGFGMGASNSNEETVTATGVHLVFTQPVSPPGVPAQYVEHILGEVFVDSLATPQGPLPDLGFSSSSSFSGSTSSSCLGGGKSGASAAGGGSSAGGSAVSGGLSPSASGYGASSQTGSSSTPTGSSMPAAFAAALKKPLWLVLAYLVWQSLVIGTALSLWSWRRGGAS